MSDKLDLTFMITTCKRLDLFKRTMESLLTFCKDTDIIQEWICIDDNSSQEDRDEMKKLYPFFKFIWKTPYQKGHPESLNIVYGHIKTKYVFSFEDDWSCSKPFLIAPYIDFLESNDNIKQIKLVNRWGKGHTYLKTIINDSKLYKYRYNQNNSRKPLENKEYDKTVAYGDDNTSYDSNYGWWWPGFTLNPSIWKVQEFKEKIGLFEEDKKLNSVFEYDYALRAHAEGFGIAFTDIGIGHIGTKVSAYVLNDNKRSYE